MSIDRGMESVLENRPPIGWNLVALSFQWIDLSKDAASTKLTTTPLSILIDYIYQSGAKIKIVTKQTQRSQIWISPSPV